MQIPTNHAPRHISMQRMGTLAVLIGAVACEAFTPPAPASRVSIEAIRVQLLYERSHTLSPDIVSSPGFAVWNAIAGEGDAKEPARDAVVGIVLKAPGDQTLTTGPLTVTVQAKERLKKRILARRTFGRVQLVHGRALVSFVVRNSTCAGDVVVHAALGSQSKDASVTLACGE